MLNRLFCWKFNYRYLFKQSEENKFDILKELAEISVTNLSRNKLVKINFVNTD